MLLLVSCLLFLPSTRAFIDCGMACRHCRDIAVNYPTREVYCAMCRECQERRRERRAMQQEIRDREYDFYPQEELEEIPPGCPTPPDCDSSLEMLHETATVPCGPAPATARTCPAITSCKERKKTRSTTLSTTPSTGPSEGVSYMPCIPCWPQCSCTSTTSSQNPVVPSTEPKTVNVTSKDFFYLYIGFPKGAINKTRERCVEVLLAMKPRIHKS